MDYNKMSDSELARIMVSYIGRVENLQGIVGRYLDGKEHNLKKRERATKKTDNGGTDNGRE